MQVPKEQLCKLLVHSLPPGVAEADLCSLLPASAPQVEKVEGNCTTEKKVLLVFKNPQDANQAFKELKVRTPTSMTSHCESRQQSPSTLFR